ncbi:MAG TPA: ankyrin repeat domain-containing protein [Candidatus Babeliales bacterium]|nr:ankyrin repeat domain-containing protein [Candidatus Babeliales bacterium]
MDLKAKRSDRVTSPLLRAIRAGDLAGVQQALQAGVAVEDPNNMGWTNLMWAVEFSTAQTVEIVAELLRAGVNVNAQDIFGYTPLIFAVRYSAAAVVAQLLAAGAQVNLADNSGVTVLEHAALAADNSQRLAIVRLLLAAGAQAPADLDPLAQQVLLAVRES